MVVLPARAHEREAAELVARHQGWIDRHVRRISARSAALAARPTLGAGRELLLRGVAHPVAVTIAADGRARSGVQVAEGGAIVVVRSATDRRSTAETLEAWLRRQARAAVAERVALRAAEMRIDFSAISIRDQATRWGSASRRGMLSFNWRLVMAPPEILDYVLVHELAHLRVAGHSATFWRLVDRHFPDSRVARRWLREHHDELRVALD